MSVQKGHSLLEYMKLIALLFLFLQNLSSWKSKLRRKSEASYTRALDADALQKEEEEAAIEEGIKRAKSYGEKMKER